MRDLSRWLAKRDDCRLYIALQAGTRLFNELNSLDITQLTFPAKAGKFPIGKAKKLARFIERHQIDIVHVHWKSDLPLAALAKWFSKLPFKFIHTRQMNMPGKKFDLYHRFVYGSMDCFIAITQYLARQAETNLPLAKHKIRQIYYGIKAPVSVTPGRTAQLKKQYRMENHFTVGLLGRISEFKGQHLLIEALEKLKNEGIRLHAFIVGEPFEEEYLERIKTYVANHHLEDQIRFLDFYENPFELITCFDALVLTTKRETFGLVLIEGMHAGISVIGSDEGGVPEIIDHEKTGLLFETWNSSSLSETLKRVSQDRQFAKKLGQAGQKKARKQFNAEVQYQKVFQTFVDVLRG
jgi:glycosyltransferase involved in cell wall biosynthesis